MPTIIAGLRDLPASQCIKTPVFLEIKLIIVFIYGIKSSVSKSSKGTFKYLNTPGKYSFALLISRKSKTCVMSCLSNNLLSFAVLAFPRYRLLSIPINSGGVVASQHFVQIAPVSGCIYLDASYLH